MTAGSERLAGLRRSVADAVDGGCEEDGQDAVVVERWWYGTVTLLSLVKCTSFLL